MRSIPAKIALAAATTIFALVLLEITARLFGYAQEQDVTPTFSWAEGELFRMKPQSTWQMAGSGDEVRVNSFGVRGPEVQHKGDAFRILCLGDSVTFG